MGENVFIWRTGGLSRFENGLEKFGVILEFNGATVSKHL
jgi:hypothetical protein